MSRYRRWCFTLNNYTEDDYHRLQLLDTDADIRYLVVGKETGDSGTPHLQGYVELRRACRLGGIKDILGIPGGHFEGARGTSQQNLEYCSKQDPNPLVLGQPGDQSQGHRTDLDQVADLVKSGASARRVLEEYPSTFIKYARGVERAIGLLAAPRDFPTQFIWRYGRTGAGKSRDTYAESTYFCGDFSCWLPDPTCTWFDGYRPDCKGVVLDEFDGSARLSYLLRLLDRYPIKVPIKGGFVEWRPRYLWITSQFSPHYYYSGDAQWPALVRRIVDFGQVIEYDRATITNYTKEHWQDILQHSGYE